jgi:hypothetical protein
MLIVVPTGTTAPQKPHFIWLDVRECMLQGIVQSQLLTLFIRVLLENL